MIVAHERRAPPSERWRGPVVAHEERLAFRCEGMERRYDVWVNDGDGAQLRGRATSEVSPFDLLWSPRGDAIAFRATGAAGERVGVLSADGEAELSGHPGTACAWRPDGGSLVAFDPARGLVEIAGEETRALAPLDDDGDPRRPAVIVAAGERLAVVTHHRADDRARVWIVDPGDSPRLLTDVPGSRAWVTPVWSPDARDVALHIVHPSRRRSILVVFYEARGGGEMAYAHDLLDATEGAAWSPSGGTIALFRTPAAAYRHAGTAPSRLTLVDLEHLTLSTPAPPSLPPGRLRFLGPRTLLIEAHDGAHTLTFSSPL